MSAAADPRDWTADEDPAAPADPRAALAAIVVVLGGLAAGSSAFALTALRSVPSPVVHVAVGATRLTLPSDLLRLPAEVGEGAQARVDLLLSWPDLGPVPRRVAAARQSWGANWGTSWGASGDSAPAMDSDEVQVSLAPVDDGPAPETRVTQLYARFLEPQVQQGPGDLLTRHFKRNSPYQGEVLIFSPPDGRKVAARCETEAFRLDPALQGGDTAGETRAEIPATCIAEFRRHGLMVQMRFPPRLAAGLDAVQRRLAGLVDRLAR